MIKYEDMNKIDNVLAPIWEGIELLIPECFRDGFSYHSYIAGGSLLSILHDKPIKDYDVFVEDKYLVDNLRRYYMDYCTEHYERRSTGQYSGLKLMISDNAITIGNVQIITKFTGSYYDVVREFDFKNNQLAYMPKGFHNHGYYDIYTLNEQNIYYSKYLQFNKDRARDISGCIMRIPHLIEKGFKISKRQISYMLENLADNGFDDREMEIINSYDCNS